MEQPEPAALMAAEAVGGLDPVVVAVALGAELVELEETAEHLALGAEADKPDKLDKLAKMA
jgi:hypothetical protein